MNWKELDFERYLLGELKGGRLEKFEKELETNSQMRERLAALRWENEAFLKENPPEWMGRALETRLAARTEKRLVEPKVWGKLLVTCCSFLMVAIWFVLNPQSMTPAGERLKGAGPALKLFLEKEQGEFELNDSDFVTQGDRILIEISRGSFSHGVVFSVDGKGVKTLHFPDRGLGTQLSEKAKQKLPFAYELDDAPHFEKFYFVGAEGELDPEKYLKMNEDEIEKEGLQQVVLLKRERAHE